ncbi:unnamed protein product [marine sediment metagenome]|uniref:Uncharacterized protein n=1 Tax=marine sediment metagenome TaxID=412755 RepID=X0ZF85_9ZZZZ
MASDDQSYGWFRIKEPLDGVTSKAQEEAIRAYALTQGFKDLRGFHMRLKMMGWDLYEVF